MLVSMSSLLEGLAYNQSPFRKFVPDEINLRDQRNQHQSRRLKVLNQLIEAGICEDGKKRVISKEYESLIDDLGESLCSTNKKTEVDWSHGYLLGALVDEVFSEDNGGFCADFGTARGFSAISVALALEFKRSPGMVMTFDILPQNKKMFWNSPVDAFGPQTRTQIWRNLPISNSLERLIFFEGPISQSVKKAWTNRVRLAFLDSQLTFEQVKLELIWVIGKQKKGDLVVLDDFGSASFSGVKEAAMTLLSSAGYQLLGEIDTGTKKIGILRCTS